MNIAKNMEIIFVAATLVLGLSTEALARSTRRPAPALERPAYTSATVIVGKTAVVIVSAKRLTAAEKAAIAG